MSRTFLSPIGNDFETWFAARGPNQGDRRFHAALPAKALEGPFGGAVKGSRKVAEGGREVALIGQAVLWSFGAQVGREVHQRIDADALCQKVLARLRPRFR